MSDTSTFDPMTWPATLEQWRLYPECETPETERNVQFWSEMAPEFARQGVTLYEPNLEAIIPFVRLPPNEDSGLPAGTYETMPGSYSDMRGMQQKSASVYPAILASGTDVFVRVVSKGPLPSRQLNILRYLAQEETRSDPRNHSIPTLQELVFKDWTFVVMPRMSRTPLSDRLRDVHSNWFSTISEIMECVLQVLEGFEFLHDHLIAHQDISDANIVINHVGDSKLGFLSRFPCRYYIIDFEISVQFSKDSDPVDRQVVGPPIENFAPSRLAPEVGMEPHCPFRADVWQTGLMFFRAFPTHSEVIARLARTMLTPDPVERPTMREAHQMARDVRSSLAERELAAPVFRNYVFDGLTHEDAPAALDNFMKGGPIAIEIGVDEKDY